VVQSARDWTFEINARRNPPECRNEERSVSDHFRIMHRGKQSFSIFPVGKAASL